MTRAAPLTVAVDRRLEAYQPAGIARYTRELFAALVAVADPARWRFLALRAWRERASIRANCEEKRPKPANVVDGWLFTPPHHRLEQWMLPIELAPRGVDIWHAPDFIPPFRRRCRAIITVHDLGFLRYRRTMTADSWRYYRQIFRAARTANQIIVPSRATRDDLLRLTGAQPARVHIVPEAPAAVFKPLDLVARAAAERRWNSGQPYALYLGTLEPRKNVGNLLRAWRAVVETRPEAPPLLLAGARGWLVDDLERLTRELNLDRHVRWLGRVDDAGLPELLGGATLLAYPSIHEGFGLPPLEAMACGVPVVTSAVSSLPEVVGDAALTVDPTDVGALATAILRVLADAELRATLADCGLRRAAEFTWERAAVATLAVYARAGQTSRRELETAPRVDRWPPTGNTF